MKTRYHLAKWSNPSETFTEESDLSKTSTLCFYDLDEAKYKVKSLRQSGEEWSIVRLAENKGPMFISDIY